MHVLGKLLRHGVIQTPNYVPVGTNGTLKAVDNALLAQHNCQLLFCNTYHLALHPGAKQLKKRAGCINLLVEINQ